MDVSLPDLAISCAALGVLSHVGYFIRGEYVLLAPRLLAIATILPPALTYLLVAYAHFSLPVAIKATSVAYGSYLTALFSSIVTYRLFFHPLRHFPGPRLAPITQFYHARQIYEKGNNHLYLERLHKEHGEYVRFGPNLLSVADPDWVEPVHSRQSHFRKSDWYDVGLPRTSLQQIRDPVLHDKRRRHGWDKAFTAASLRSYDSRVVEYTDLLVDQLQTRAGQAVNASKWFNAFAFDVMGDLVFGRTFKALETGDSHPVIDAIHNGGVMAKHWASLPWFGFGVLLDYSQQYVKERQTYEPDEPDIMSHILGAGQFFSNEKEEELLLQTDSRLLIIAGSDTTAAALTFAAYNFAREPSIVDKLRSELDEHGITNGPDLNVQQLNDLPYLNGVINETLRVHPPVPAGFVRETPPEGVNMGGHFLPGGVKLLTPTLAIQTSPKAFVKPKEFIPERWTTSPELVLKKDAFFPFLIGRFSCIGKQLALNELRMVITKLVLELDINFAEGEDGRALLEESIDANTMILADLNLQFTSRKG